MEQKKVIVCSEISSPNWKWVTHHFPEHYSWSFCPAKASANGLMTIFRRGKAAFKAVWQARRADAIVSHGPAMAFYCAVFLWLLRVKTPHASYSFNFAELPTGFALRRMQIFFKKVNSLVVSSRMERQLYSRYFKIPLERLDFVLWGVAEPKYELKTAPTDHAYISTVGGNARDYTTFMAAMAELPELQAIAVMRPHNLAGLQVPSNVKVLVNSSQDEALSIIKHSRLTVLPLAGSTTPCGHVTIVAAMNLGVPCVVTDSSGVSDYVDDSRTGFLVEPNSIAAMKVVIEKAFNNHALRADVSVKAESFVKKECYEVNYKNHFVDFINRLELDFEAQEMPAEEEAG